VLNNKQIEYLVRLSGSSAIYEGDQPISILLSDTDQQIVQPYETFRNRMGLADLRWHGLLGKRNMIAGGAVLNWVWGENTNEDTDFFFLNADGKNDFASFVSTPAFEFHRSGKTGYADSYFNAENNVLLQLVSFCYGEPFNIMRYFDLNVCKWVADADWIYTYRRAITDLLELRMAQTRSPARESPLHRILKYHRKGFFLSTDLMSKIKI
jgi:hypothetical protein